MKLKTATALIFGEHEKYIGALNEIFSLWMEHLKEEGLGESNDFHTHHPISTRLQ